MVIYISGKEDERLWEIILGPDFIIKAGKGVCQDSAFQTLPLKSPNEREELMYIPNNPVIAQNGQQQTKQFKLIIVIYYIYSYYCHSLT